jgi:activator of HSP90 ATPase
MNTVRQSVTFKATAEELFKIFTDSKKHSAATGAPAKVSRQAGARWSAFGGQIGGRNLMVVPEKLVVQAWRASHWKKSDLDSILIIRFSGSGKGGRVDLVHTNLPDHDVKGVSQGWPNYYWKPWKAFLSKQGKKRGQ